MFSNSIDSPQHCENTMAILSSFKEEPLLHLLPKMNFNMTAIESCYQNDFMELLRAAQGQGVGYLLHIPYNNET